MRGGVRFLAGLLALGIYAVPVQAQVDRDELEGSYTIDAARAVSADCQLVERGSTIQVINAGDTSMQMSLGQNVNLNFSPETGAISMNDDGVTIDGRFTRLRDQIRLNMALTTAAPFDCTISIEASKPAAESSTATSPQGAAEVADGTDNVAATPSPVATPTSNDPTDDEVRDALWGDNTTLLVIAFLVLLIGSAAVAYRNQNRLWAKEDATAKTRQNRGAKKAECHRLHAELRVARERYYAMQQSPLYGLSAKADTQEDIKDWRSLREQFLSGDAERDPGPWITELGLEGQAAKDFRYSPATFAQREIERHQRILEQIEQHREDMSDLDDEIEYLEDQRKKLGCEKLEKAHPPPA